MLSIPCMPPMALSMWGSMALAMLWYTWGDMEDRQEQEKGDKEDRQEQEDMEDRQEQVRPGSTLPILAGFRFLTCFSSWGRNIVRPCPGIMPADDNVVP